MWALFWQQVPNSSVTRVQLSFFKIQDKEIFLLSPFSEICNQYKEGISKNTIL